VRRDGEMAGQRRDGEWDAVIHDVAAALAAR
jgi:hypothetical protein